MRILITDELSLSTILSPASRSFIYTFSFAPTVITARQLAAVTPQHHDVRILEGKQNIPLTGSIDVAHLNFKTAIAPAAYKVADTLRSQGVTVVLSGYHPSALPNEAAHHADIVIAGDAITLWPQVVHDLETGTPQKIYQDQGTEKNLILPSTDSVVLTRTQLTNSIEATRGCPQKCDFCQDANIRGGAILRKRPIDNVIHEIQRLPQKIFFFTDFSLTIDLSYTKDLFRRLHPLKKKFVCGGNIDVLAEDDELLRLAHQAGCIEWISGFETFTQEALQHAKKKSNIVQDYQRAVTKIHRYHMAIFGTFVLGFDEDTTDVFTAMHTHIQILGLDAVNFAILTPYPGTPLFQRLDAEGRILTKDWEKYDRQHVVYTPKQMTPQQLQQGFKHLTRRYSTLPSMGFRTLRSLRLGLYPALATGAGNFSQYMKTV